MFVVTKESEPGIFVVGGDDDDYDSKDDAQLMPPPSWLPDHSKSEQRSLQHSSGAMHTTSGTRILNFIAFRWIVMELHINCIMEWMMFYQSASFTCR